LIGAPPSFCLQVLNATTSLDASQNGDAYPTMCCRKLPADGTTSPGDTAVTPAEEPAEEPSPAWVKNKNIFKMMKNSRLINKYVPFNKLI